MPEMVADALVILKRNLIKFRRQPEMLIGYTVQPIMFVLLFVYVFGGSIDTGMDYEDFLIPGIIVQNITFGGALTAVGLVEDMKKGLIDRFRSLPMARSAVLAGRTLADVVVNLFGVIIVIAVGYVVGFRFSTSVPEVLYGIVLLLLFGYAFSWIFALVGLYSTSAESAQQTRIHRHLPADVHLVRVRADRKHAGATGSVCRSEPVHHHGGCHAPSLRRHSSGQFRVGRDVVVDRSDHCVRADGRSQIPSRFLALSYRSRRQARAQRGDALGHLALVDQDQPIELKHLALEL